ncbi:MAG TPA: hypothetical protein VMU54_14375 [Planctomycetota bacterium]|nr:hypothetical protein [Planctomycetota bacterium]
MTSDLFEKNIRMLVRQAALPLENDTRMRARAEFLRAAEATPSGRSGGLAVAAAALLICALLYGAARSGTPPAPPSPPFSRELQEAPPAATTFEISGGNELLKGVLRIVKGADSSRTLRFEGRSPLPEGIAFHAVLMPAVNRLVKGRLEEDSRSAIPTSTRLESGGFTVEWEAPPPGMATLQFRAPDDAQEIPILSLLKTMESAREWSFVALLWDDGLLSKLEPQLGELTQLAADMRDLVARVEASCATMELFKAQEKALIAEARRMEARANGISTTGLFPAASQQIAYTAGDLATSMPIFTWRDGKFDGPSSYYTNHQRGKTFRGDLFDFDALRRYLDECVIVGGREFDLWIANDLRRSGLRPLLIEAVNRSAKRRGVLEFAERLRSGAVDGALLGEIRQIAP